MFLIWEGTMLILSGRPHRILISVFSESSMGGGFFFFSLKSYKEDNALITVLPCQLSDYWLSWGKKNSFLLSASCYVCTLRMLMRSKVQYAFLLFVLLCDLPSPTKFSLTPQSFPCTAHRHSLRTVRITNKGSVWQPLENEWVRRLSRETHCKY